MTRQNHKKRLTALEASLSPSLPKHDILEEWTDGQLVEYIKRESNGDIDAMVSMLEAELGSGDALRELLT